MRIVFVAPFGLAKKATVWARTLPLARCLVAKDCEVSVLIPPWDAPEEAGRSWIDGGVEVINVALQGGLPLITARLLSEVRSLRPDIVHIVKPRAYAGIVQWFLWNFRSGSRPRIVLDVDDWEQAWAPITGYAPPITRFLAWQENWGYRHADAITAASGWLVHKARELAPGAPCLYLPNGVSADQAEAMGRPRAFDPGRPRTVLWFTRFVEVEPEWMAACWQALQSLDPDLHLLVAGAPLQPGRDHAFRRAMGREDPSITWLGYVPPASLPDVYARSDCTIFPAANVPLNLAKCSVKVANTLLAGVPVVASAVGEQARYGAAGAARLVEAEASPAAFARAVIEHLADPEERARQVQAARQRLLNQYAWSRLAEDLLTLYRVVAA